MADGRNEKGRPAPAPGGRPQGTSYGTSYGSDAGSVRGDLDYLAQILHHSQIPFAERNQADLALKRVERLYDVTVSALSRLTMEIEQRVAERTAQLGQTREQVNQEIAQLKRVDEALRTSEARFKAIFDS